MFETKRLILRSFRDTDIDELFDYRNNYECKKYQRYDDTSKNYLINLINVNKNIVFLSEAEQHLAITLKTGELIGDLSIFFKNRTITIGYTISYKYQRNGYAYEILSNLIKEIHDKYKNYEIVAMTEKGNEASINLLKKLGFSNEGYEEKIESYIFSLYAT
ncbi:GNAT family N-acetyltransferase [Clostridium nigeriense]|uniref:GNAT family N-acetyltransferase n=1 Tax=Clostridium nigeriense TaxID=1805470 RepID=UPI003D349F34